MIEIARVNATEFRVTVHQSTTTEHLVTVRPEYAERLRGSASDEDLLRASFEFLLEEESNTSILRSFDLSVIQRYFPHYESTMRARFAG